MEKSRRETCKTRRAVSNCRVLAQQVFIDIVNIVGGLHPPVSVLQPLSRHSSAHLI